ncbi:hypothetical protein EDC94DRAFT_690552 [Helicostylum pulchrum]|nr:hypothetical protein EDC94DRAFT_690552 [Helicostylum pulchrum]
MSSSTCQPEFPTVKLSAGHSEIVRIGTLTSVADRLQSKVDEASTQMNKKLEEMTKRIDTLERNLKQMEPPAGEE